MRRRNSASLPAAMPGPTAILKAEARDRAAAEGGRPAARRSYGARRRRRPRHRARLTLRSTVAAGPVAGYGKTTVTGTEAMDPGFTAYMTGWSVERSTRPRISTTRATGWSTWVSSTAWRSARPTRSTPAATSRSMSRSANARSVSTASARRFPIRRVSASRAIWGHRNLFGKRREAAHRGLDRPHRRHQRIWQAQLQCRHHVREAGRRRAGVAILHRPEDRLRTSRRLRPLLGGRQCRPRL